MKKISIIASALILSSSMLSADITIKTGWQLLGATQDMNTTMFNDTCVDYIWKYNTTVPEWQLHVANGVDYAHSMTTISSFTKGEGYWVKGNADCTIALDDTTEENLTKSFINISTDGFLKATLDPDGIENSSFKGVISVGNYVYVVSRDGKLLTYDITSLEETELPIQSLSIGGTSHIVQNGNYLYVSGYSLSIIDISNPGTPTLVKTVAFTASWNTPTISNNKMLLTNSYSSSKVSLLDVSTPDTPTLLTTFDTIGKSIIVDDFIYSIDSTLKVTKYSLSSSNTISEVSSAIDNIDSLPYHLYHYNNQFIVITSSNIYIYDTTNNMALLKTITVSSTRTAGCKNNVCIVGTKIYDLNNIDNTPLRVFNSTSTIDGFPFQAYINDNGYIFRGSQADVKVNKIDFLNFYNLSLGN